jgi:hypothetical protein
MALFDHLVEFEPEPEAPGPMVRVEKASVPEIADAQAATAQWLEELGVSDRALVESVERDAARRAFETVTLGDIAASREAMLSVKAPLAVRHLAGLLTAYDWEFVQQAQQLRGYVVATLMEETKHTNPHVRLKALGMLGRVTEVGLFTEKVEVSKPQPDDEVLMGKIRERLSAITNVAGLVERVDTDEGLPRLHGIVDEPRKR